MHRYWLLCYIVFASGCNQPIDRLEQQRAIWTEKKPSSYAYTIQVSGWREPALLHPKRVMVKDGHVVSAVYVWSSAEGEAGAAAPAASFWAIDTVFDELVRAKVEKARVRARFDDELGFVERSFIDYGKESSGWDVEIRDFESLVSVSNQ